MLTVTRFTSKTCQPCQQLHPIFQQLENELNNETDSIIFQTIDTDNQRQTAIDNNVSSVPTVILSKNGQQVYRFSGVLPKQTITGIIRKYL